MSVQDDNSRRIAEIRANRARNYHYRRQYQTPLTIGNFIAYIALLAAWTGVIAICGLVYLTFLAPH